MTDDLVKVRLSERVMTGRHALTDPTRREETRGGGGGGETEGSLAALSFNLRRDGRWGQQGEEKKNLKSPQEAVESLWRIRERIYLLRMFV